MGCVVSKRETEISTIEDDVLEEIVEARRSSLRSLELHNAKTASLDYPVAVDDQMEEVKMREELRRGLSELEKRASREVF